MRLIHCCARLQRDPNHVDHLNGRFVGILGLFLVVRRRGFIRRDPDEEAFLIDAVRYPVIQEVAGAPQGFVHPLHVRGHHEIRAV